MYWVLHAWSINGGTVNYEYKIGLFYMKCGLAIDNQP